MPKVHLVATQEPIQIKSLWSFSKKANSLLFFVAKQHFSP